MSNEEKQLERLVQLVCAIPQLRIDSVTVTPGVSASITLKLGNVPFTIDIRCDRL